jgi:asparagine synthase (glutamine-hydrolysing)
MRWSIETRIPFLDFNLVEAAMGCTSAQKIHNSETKWIFRQAVKDLLPPLILNRKDKIGFMASSDELFRDEKIVNFSKDILVSETFKNRPYWKWEKTHTIFNAHQAGKVNAGDTIWKWLNTELWLRNYFD